MRHTSPVNPSPTSSSENRPAKPQTSVGQVFALVAGFIALAAIGAAIGWTLTDTNGSNPAAGPSTPVPVTSSVTSTAPSSSPPSPPPSSAPAGFTLPDYAAEGKQFQDARSELLAQGIGVVVKFQPKGVSGGAVVSTNPAAGTLLTRGQNVTINVSEAPPPLAVPSVLGSPCNDAGHTLAMTGFTPSYPNGRNGSVTAQLPQPDDPSNPTARWNDTVAITCGTAPPPASPAPSPSVSPSTN